MTHSEIKQLPRLDEDNKRAETCPSCKSSWRGEPIPEKNLQYYGGTTHYSRLIGIEYPGLYDGVLVWRCPDCHTLFRRF